MSQGDEEYRVQQQKLSEAIDRKSRRLDERFGERSLVNGFENLGVSRSSLFDRNTRIFEKILSSDFRNQVWIEKDSAVRKTRKNIDENYRLVTGQGGLGSKELKDRKDSFEKKRMLSSRASEKVADLIASQTENEKELHELAEEVALYQVREFSFESDEDLVDKFGEKMQQLMKAEICLRKLDEGGHEDLAKNPELYRKLLCLKDIKAAYEERMVIITSPYYVSVKDEDYTEETLEHMKTAWKRGEKISPEYVDAVLSWHKRKKDPKAFKTGIKEMDEEYVDRLAGKHREVQDLLSAQDAAGLFVEIFDEKVREEAKESGFKFDVSVYSLREISDYMKKDTKSKSMSYLRMERALADVFRMRNGVTEYGTVKSENSIADYRDVVRYAERTALDYCSSHTKWFHFTDKGDERYRMSVRLVELLGRLRREMNTLIERDVVRPEIEERQETESDVDLIIETGAFSSEEAGKEIKGWLLDNPEYKAVLSRIVRGKEELAGDREVLLRFLEDKNRLLVANTMTLSMVCDEHPELTLRLPALKKELRDYIDSRLKEDPKKQEKIYSEVKEFRLFIDESIRGFYEKNSDRLTRISERKEEFADIVKAEESDEALWEREEIEDLLLSDYDNETFSAKVAEIAQLKENNTRILERMADETGWSATGKKSLVEKLKERLGAVLIFGGEFEVYARASQLITAADYFVPAEAEAERRISRAMYNFQVPAYLRDALADVLSSKGDADAITKLDYESMIARTESFMDRFRFLYKTLNAGGTDGRRLSSAQWKRVEELEKRAGFMSRQKISLELDRILGQDQPGLKLSRSEYKKQVPVKNVKSIGFTQGILGDRFLGSDEVKAVLEPEEIAYLNENLMSRLSADDETFALLEGAKGTDIEKIASVMRENLRKNAAGLLELKNDKDLDVTVKRRVLLRTVCLDAGSDEEVFKRILEEEKKEFEDKTALSREMQEVRDLTESGVPAGESLRLKAITYKKRLNYLKSFKGGRFEILAPFLMQTPEFYEKVMSLTRREFMAFVGSDLEERFGTLAGALKASSVGSIVLSLYLDEKFRDIFSGKLTGNAAFFKRDIDVFERKVFTEKGSDGRSLQQNFDDALNSLVKSLKGDKKEIRQRTGVIFGVSQIVLKRLLDKKTGFESLKSQKGIREELERALKNYDANARSAYEMFKVRLDLPSGSFYGADEKEKEILAAQFGQFVKERLVENSPQEFERLFFRYAEEFEKKQAALKASEGQRIDPALIESIRTEAEERKDSKKAFEARRKFLGYSETMKKAIGQAFAKKALVNLGTGHEMDLSHRSWQVARDHLNERLGYLGPDLDPFIIDCLVEKNATTWYDEAIDRTPGVHFVVRKLINDGFKTLEENARWLVDARLILKDSQKGEEPLSEDELNLMLVYIYRNEKKFLLDDGSGNHDRSRKTIRGKWFEDFRKNYRELKALEGLELSYPALRQEQLGLSRELRALLSTGMGLKGQDFKVLASRGRRYLTRVSELQNLAVERLHESPDFKELDERSVSFNAENLRQYFNSELLEELTDENEGAVFNRNLWQTRIDGILSDRVKTKAVVYSQKAVSYKDFSEKNGNYTSFAGRGLIDRTVETYGWPGQRKKYRQLSDEGKEFFALALMLMDKTALGLQGGSARVLGCRELEKDQAGLRLVEVKKYLEGQAYDLKVDYAQSYYKLINYGYDFTNEAGVKLSDTAYDKALEFAEGIVKRRYSPDEKDIERAGDPSAVIIDAGLLGKDEQAREMSLVLDETWSPEKLRAGFFSYMQKDFDKIMEKSGKGWFAPLKNGQAMAEADRIENVSRRMKRLSRVEFLRLIAVLQNRTALDVSTRDETKAVNEDKREELKLMLSDDEKLSDLGSFASPGSCLNALLSCLSFKINDDRKLGDERLLRSDLDQASFDREGLVDWELLQRALDLLDEARKDSVARYAVRHASDYIENSGNQRAVEEFGRFKGNRSMDETALTDFLKEQAKRDSDSGENPGALLAYGGFEALSPKQKKLFFRVLGQRDLLDISKRNLYRNIFRASAERSYSNEVGRFRLIDEFIDRSRGGNEGITLSETAHYDALRSLLSTQVDDTSDFDSISDVKKALAGERLFVFQRKTAIDWKLFTRALQFVNRASYELEISEGNAELYRSAGDIGKHGHMKMDYSVLRQNIHNTGNQFFRFGVQRGLEFAGPNVLKDLKIDIFGLELEVGDIAGTITDAAALIMPESAAATIKEIKETLIDGKTGRKTGSAKLYQFKPGKENEDADKKAKKQIDAAHNGIDATIAQIDSIFSDAKLMKKSAAEMGSFINHLIPAPSQMSRPSGAKKEEEKEDLLEEQIAGFKTEKRFGDIRDTIVSVKKTMKKPKEVFGVAKGLPYVNDKVRDVIKHTQVLIIDSFARYAAGGTAMPWVEGALKDSYAIFKEEKLEKLKKSKLEELVKKGEVPKDYKFTDDDIKSHKYWTAKDEELTDDERLKAADNAAKTYLSGIIEGMVGKENAEKVYKALVDVREFTASFREKMVIAGAVVNTAKVYLESFVDIAERSKKLGLLDDAEERAEKREVKERDESRLSEAKEHQSEDQQKLSAWTAEHHLDLERMASEVSETIQGIEISRDVANLVIQTGVVAANLSGADPTTTKIVSEAIKAGVDFALYCVRVLHDQDMLDDYYRNTSQGLDTLKGIIGGAREAFGREEVGKTDLVREDNVLDIICAGKGYEKREELVTDTGLRMAASIAYSASPYNPILQNRIRAVTCMAVLGMKDRVGKTDSGTISAIFEAMKAA